MPDTNTGITRVTTYIDGFNLYFGLKSKSWRKYYWLDLVALSKALLKPGQAFQHCHYFTARVRDSGNRNQSARRQTIWLDALSTLPDLSTHFGHYLAKTRTCAHCGSSWRTYEEKMTDVNIATQLLIDAYDDSFDTAIVISGDSDLVPPVKAIKSRFPGKRVIAVFPPNRVSAHLRKVAHGSLSIGQDKLRQNLLPDALTTPDGQILQRPMEWR